MIKRKVIKTKKKRKKTKNKFGEEIWIILEILKFQHTH